MSASQRPETAGPDEGPQAPFPLRLNGKVIKGFGRGSSEVWMALLPFLLWFPTFVSEQERETTVGEHAGCSV